jgi:hypothetical protein
MTQLYGREYVLTIGSRQWTDLRMSFEVKRTLAKYPDPATITIYNLSAATRASFSRGDEVRLVAGYKDNAGLLYSGQLQDMVVARDGPDWATTVTVRDGDNAWRTQVNTRFASSTPLQIAVQRMASAMGLQILPTSLPLLAGRSVRSGSVHVGNGHDAMSRLLTPWSLRWLIQDGVLIVLPSDGATSQTAIVLSPDTGLVGSPEPMTDKAAKPFKKNGAAQAKTGKRMRLTSLLQPGLTPGRLVVLESTQYVGTYRVDSAIHRGDSRGQDWYSIVETTLMGAT